MAFIDMLLKSKMLKKKLTSQISRFSYQEPRATESLKNFHWVRYAHAALLIVGIFVVPFILVPWIFSVLQPMMAHDEGHTIFVSAPYVIPLASFVLFPLVYLSLSYLLSYYIPSIGNYMAAQEIYDQSVKSGIRKKQPKGELQQHRLERLNKIQSQYDVRAFILWRLKRSVCVLAFLTLLAVPFVYFAFDDYILVHDEGVTVDPFTSLTSRSYSWSEIESSELSIEETITDGRRQVQEVKHAPEFRITFSDNTSVDLWQFGLLSSSAEEIIALCTQIDKNGVEVEQERLSNISGLRQSIQKEIRQVWDAPACGAFSLR